MRALTPIVYRLTGLLHPGWSLRLGPSPGEPAKVSRGALGVRLSGERRRGHIAGGVPAEEVLRCTYDGARLEGPVLAGRCAFSTLRLAAITAPRASEGARLLACDLEGASIEGGALTELEVQGCSLRDATLRDTRIGALNLCDLSGAHLEAVRVERALGSDFEGATLLGCDLSGADLCGSSFRRAHLEGCTLAGARVLGVDFSGASGLDAGSRRALAAGGARVRVGLSPPRIAGALAATAALVAGLLALIPPPVPAPPTPTPSDRAATASERERTRESLAAVRAGLERAHERLLSSGAEGRTWPSIQEFSENRFDVDGDGPGETYDSLFPEGMPENYLTDVRGSVLPYCNEVPTQETLSGVDADWHYCELTGRVFASAGRSGEATLNW